MATNHKVCRQLVARKGLSDRLGAAPRRTRGQFVHERLDVPAEAREVLLRHDPSAWRKMRVVALDARPSQERTPRVAVQFGLEHLDAGFFRSRWERATPSERRLLLAMAQDHDAPSQTADIARRIGLKITSLGSYRANLIAKGLIYAPEHGQVSYTVPGMAAFVKRHRDDLDRPDRPGDAGLPSTEDG